MRLSLDESRVQFAKRFMVTPITVFNWERGKSLKIQNIHEVLLRDLANQLATNGRLIQPEVAEQRYQREVGSGLAF